MGIILGILCLICFCILSVKSITKKFHLEKMDGILMRIHKPASVILIALCVLHILWVVPVLKNRSIFVIVSGIAVMLILIWLICFMHIKKDNQKRMWWHRVLTVLMVISIIGHIVAYIIDFKEYQYKVTNISFDEIDLASIKDGVYDGEYDAGYIYARVEVEIREGQIISIHLVEHRNEQGKEAESILEDVVANQKIDVDAVSGATNSSKVIKKAIENALKETQ